MLRPFSFPLFARRLVLAFIVTLSLFIVSDVALAQSVQPTDFGIEQAAATGLPANDIRVVIARIIQALLGFLGLVILVLILYGGFLWMTAGGNEEQIGRAKKTLANAGIGFGVTISAFAITTFIISQLVGAVTGGGDGLGGGGGGTGGPGDGGFSGSGAVLYVVTLPQQGQACVQNTHPSISFSRDVDLATVQRSVAIQKQGVAGSVPGRWEYGSRKSIVQFIPEGSCAGDATRSDCFEPNTAYQLLFTAPSSVRSLDGLTLNCTLKAKCGPVDFVTGTGIERNAPRVTITRPTANSSFPVGENITVSASYVSDSGVQSLSLAQGSLILDGKNGNGCAATGTVDLVWNTAGVSPGRYDVEVVATGWSGLAGNARLPLTVVPLHCFDTVLDADKGETVKGPPACGGVCGACGGASCTDSGQCASGYCDLSSGQGVCVDRMRITSVTPASGAPGTYVTVQGLYFGTVPGSIYFPRVANPSSRLADWVKAPLVACVVPQPTWTPTAAIVEVPNGAVNGPIMVVTASTSQQQSFTDITNDGWGPSLADFRITNEVKPGICAVTPAQGGAGTAVQFFGKNFGLLDSNNDEVFFGAGKAVVVPTDWSDVSVKTKVPATDAGIVAARITAGGVESNAIRFLIEGGEAANAPLISSVSPATGAVGEYVTISGKNFGSAVGAVWFKATAGSEAIVGDMAFPAECGANVWRDDQIVVKFPKDKGVVGTSYAIQVKTSDNRISGFEGAPQFRLASGVAAPGICKISPLSGPSPFPDTESVVLTGEYFGSNPQVYFWKNGANPGSVDGRVVVPADRVVAATESRLEVRPPAGIATGPVVVRRPTDAKVSNPINFSVTDCTKNNNICGGGGVCCSSGTEAGMCKPAGELCEGALRSTAYVWRFTTNDIPEVPRVVERCDANVDAGVALPSPSPSTLWSQGNPDDHTNVCRTALVTVEFSVALDQDTVNASSVMLQKCSGVSSTQCINPTAVPLTQNSFNLNVAASSQGGKVRTYLTLQPQNMRFEDASWYRVILNKSITSVPLDGRSVPLAIDRPCTADAAYCFTFKTGNQDCRMKSVVVTPYSYWTSVLEAPMKHRSAGEERELRYNALGMSDQRCILMDTSDFSWNWGTGNRTYATIFGEAMARSAQVSAVANTVGVGLSNPDDAVLVNVTAQRGGNSYTGKSPLTIDLNDPAVVDYWPRCLEACSVAEVAVKFNTSLSERNLPGAPVGGTVQLLKCRDENCRSTTPVLTTTDVYLEKESNYTVLKIANSRAGSIPLEQGTLYQVIVSASSTNPFASTNQIWSAARLNDPTTFSRPYNGAFTWRFKTKRDSCRIDRVEISPSEYVGQNIKDRSSFEAAAFTSPDSCSAQGQKLNPWLVGWNWTSSDEKVATLSTFNTKGKNPSCSAECVRRGSAVPAGTSATVPLCGNGIIEAGEDCDRPDKAKGCSLDCRFMGSTGATCGNGTVEKDRGEACDPKDPATQIGCSSDCRNLGAEQNVSSREVTASICGTGVMGSGKDCDVQIPGQVSDPRSALFCSEKCLHQGTPLSSAWCSDNRLTKGGFTTIEYDAACSKALSQCGNGFLEPEEDPGCDGTNGWNKAECNEFCKKMTAAECIASSEGCDPQGRLLGSSLSYSIPSVCGDGKVGIGEVPMCENNLVSSNRDGLIDPWSLAIGQGLGMPSGDPPTQKTIVTGGTSQQTTGGIKSGQATFALMCGYSTDNECQAVFGNDYGVGANTCCTKRSSLISTYPANGTTNACPNTYLEALFDSQIDQVTLKEGIVIARGADDCGSAEEVTGVVAALTAPRASERWYARAWNEVRSWFGTSVTAAPTKWCVAPDTATAEVVPAPEVSPQASRIRVKLTKPLALDTDYAIVLKDSIRTTAGVSVGRTAGKFLSWKFSTVTQICEVNSVAVEPKEWSFTRANATTTLAAKAKTNNGTFIQGVPGVYDWSYVWGPFNDASVAVQNTSSSANIITAQNRNGETMVRASAVITANQLTTATGTAATGQSRVIVLLCENPWPPKDLRLNGQGPFSIFPFDDAVGNNDGFDLTSNTFNNTPLPASPVTREGYFNFSTYYCADKGVPGTADDLPYLRGTVQISPTIVSATTSLKRFLFSNTKNSDVVGIQVFPNPGHLSAAEWYSLDRAQGGQGFTGQLQKLTVDGYEAVSDGNNVYIDGLNYAGSTNALFSNIYLVSINANAQADTRAVFDQILKNFKIATNLTNYGYCGVNADKPSFTTQCRVDLECPSGQVCSAVEDKLRRNYQRLRGARTLQNALSAYSAATNGTYPELAEGSYLKGQTLSTWPSWSNLATALRTDLPGDPINALAPAGTCERTTNRFCTQNAECPTGEACVIHDQQTAWSVQDRRFSFACPTSSLAYRYISISPTKYLVKGRLEDAGISLSNLDTLIRDFVDPSSFIFTDKNGICNQDQEISTLNQGRCGDGVINYSRGEECDPVGSQRFGACSAEQAGRIRVDVCSSSCTFVPSSTPFIACSALSSCGNGKVEAGETCDDGVLNGTYNHCSKSCTYPPADPPGYCGDGKVQGANETCDIRAGLGGQPGWCLGGVNNGAPCTTSATCNIKDAMDNGVAISLSSQSGVCRLVETNAGRYAPAQANSCSFDCKARGAYCGDGIVQTQFGEECDGAAACTVSGLPGSKQCSSSCRLVDATAAGWWRFSDFTRYSRSATMADPYLTVADSAKGIVEDLVCVDTECPSFSMDGKFGGAFSFNGSHFLRGNDVMTRSAALNATSSLTVEAWVYPTNRAPWMRILEKGGYQRDGGYTFQFDEKGEKASLAIWNAGASMATSVTGRTIIPLNRWTHVMATYLRTDATHSLQLFVNGELDNAVTIDSAGMLLAPSDDQIIIGRATSGGSGFIGRLDELKVHLRALNPIEIQDRAANESVCSLTSVPKVAAVAPGASCGDGKVTEGEACDRGAQNGVPCVPAYGKSCSYCHSSCRVVIDVQSAEFCGNAKVEAPEACETDAATQLIYSALPNSTTKQEKDPRYNGYEVLSCADEATAPDIVKKGTKSCVSSCSAVQSNCAICGTDLERGVNIAGSVINILDPKNPNPLYDQGRMDLTMSANSTDKRVGVAAWSAASAIEYKLRPASDPYSTTDLAKLSTDSRCSFGEGPLYTMYFNGDNTHPFNFPVLAKPETWQNDFVLSPIINRNERPNDIRVVVRWVGTAVDFVSGWQVFRADPDNPYQLTTVESTAYSSNNIRKGPNYYDYPPDILNGLWYHGFTTTKGNTNAMSFTINSNALYNDKYIFFVRLPNDVQGISRFRSNTQLKVEVYVPEDGPANAFAVPAATFYLNQAASSENPNASYWQVFALKRDPSAQPKDRILRIDKITTDVRL